MISFKELNSNNAERICEELSLGLSVDAGGYLSEIIYGIDTDSEDVDYAVSVWGSCLLIRIFDMGRYLFVFPCELDEEADLSGAISAVAEYAMREEVPLSFVDVPSSCLNCFGGYMHMDVDAEDPECLSYRVRIKTECEIVSEIPYIKRGRVELTQLCEEDIPLYAALCKDKNLNKYWGYDYSEDVPEPSDSYFFENAAHEFARGAAMTMAIRVEGAFSGDVTLYAFDGKGGAEFAIRLFSDLHGRGIGTETVLTLAEAARSMGLVRLHAKIMKENLSSIAMMRKVTDICSEDGDRFYFTVEL